MSYRMDDPRDLTGLWYGSWRSADGRVAPGRFIVVLADEGGILSGESSEPDPFGGPPVNALWYGRRDGAAVEWTKQYDGAGKLAHTVAYAGVVDPEGCAVIGEWRLAAHSGPFVMRREKFTIEELEAGEPAVVSAPGLRITDYRSPFPFVPSAVEGRALEGIASGTCLDVARHKQIGIHAR